MAPRQSYEGKLELTWTNKDMSLLAHEDSSYEWVPPGDYRVAEVRLLREGEAVGEVATGAARMKDNLLIRGDALHALTSLLGIPEYAREYAGKVKCVYIDPPFNTQQAFANYDDALEHSVWLTMIRDRLEQVKELLRDDGSVWVHCDDSEQHRLRSVMDEVFGRDQFIASVIWEKSDSPRMDAHNFSGRHDYILVYSKTAAFEVNRLGKGVAQPHYNKTDEDGTAYYLKPLRAMGGQGGTRAARPTLYYSIDAPDGEEVWPKLPDGGDGAWRWSKEKVKRDKALIDWVNTERGWSPYFRIYDKGKGRPPETIWPHAEVGSNRTSKKEIKDLFPTKPPFGTPKPERLMARIIHLASNAGDIVLDCFAGSGTTAAVAHKMGRRWVTVEWSRENIDDYVFPRLTKVARGDDAGGVTDEMDWEGGGGLRVLDVAPSMFAEDEGLVVLADWAVDGKLGEATAAQLGYDYAPAPPFVGRKGRTRLAVVDGLVNPDVANLLVRSLSEQERLVLCGTAVDPETRQALRELRPGSTVRKIPASILAEYQMVQRWPRSSAAETEVVVPTTGDERAPENVAP